MNDVPGTDEKVFYWHENHSGRGGRRCLIVGDVHGEVDLLDRLARLVNLDPEQDTLICAGDLVDRGSDSAAVLRWFSKSPRRISLLGNHDALMLDARHDIFAYEAWMRNGGHWSMRIEDDELSSFWEQVSNFPLVAELRLADGRAIGVVHAEVRPGSTWAEVRRVAHYQTGMAVDDSALSISSSLIWGRNRYIAGMLLERYQSGDSIDELSMMKVDEAKRDRWQRTLLPVDGVDLVIGGHTIMNDRVPVQFGSHLFIDTGAYKTPHGRLTAVDPIAGVYWQVGHDPHESWGPLALPPPRLPFGQTTVDS